MTISHCRATWRLRLKPWKWAVRSAGIGMGLMGETFEPPVFPIGTQPNRWPGMVARSRMICPLISRPSRPVAATRSIWIWTSTWSRKLNWPMMCARSRWANAPILSPCSSLRLDASSSARSATFRLVDIFFSPKRYR